MKFAIAWIIGASLSLLVCRAHADELQSVYDNKWRVTVSVEPEVKNSQTSAVGIRSEAQYETFAFQANGTIRLTISLEHLGEEEGEIGGLRVTRTWPAPALVHGESSASNAFLIDNYYKSESIDSRWGEGFFYTIEACWYRAAEAEPKPCRDWLGKNIEVTMAKFRHMWIGSVGYSTGARFVGMFDLINSGGSLVRETVTGEPLDIVVAAPLDEPIQIIQESPSSSHYSEQMAQAFFWIVSTAGSFADGEMKQVTIRATDSANRAVYRTFPLPFATVIDASSFGVHKKDQLAGTWVPILTSEATRMLVVGDEIRLQPQVDAQGNVAYPFARVLFVDGSVHELEMRSWDPERASDTIVTIGRFQPQYKAVNWTVQLESFARDVQLNHREYLREIIWDNLLDGTLNLLSPGSGWFAKRGAREVINIAIERAADHLPSPRREHDPSPLLDPGQPQPPKPLALGAASSSAGSAFRRSLAAGNPAAASRYTADSVITLNMAGELKIENYSGIRSVEDANGASALVGPFNKITYSSAAEAFTGGGMINSVESPMTGLQISPPDGSHINTRTPLLTFDYDLPNFYYIPDSLAVRVNGKLAENFYRLESGQAKVQLSRSAPLADGENIIEAYIRTRTGYTMSARAAITAHELPRAPSGAAAWAGSDYLILAWTKNVEPDVLGYHVYYGSSASTIAARLTTNLLPEPAFVVPNALVPGLADGRWFGVTAVTGGGESALSQPAYAAAGRAAVTPGVPPSLAAAGDERRVILTLGEAANALVYRLEKRQSGGSFQAIPDSDTYLSASTFVDTTVSNDVSYEYRLTPYGVNLQAGPSITSAWVAPRDNAPQAPQGFTVERRYGGAEYVLRWNPSSETDVAGYNIYGSKNRGPYGKRNTQLFTGHSWHESVTEEGIWQFRVTAVDAQGHESAASFALVGGSGCPLPSPLPVRPSGDSDGDGVPDEQENDDGSDSTDAGSYEVHLQSPVYALWTGFLNIVPIAEIFNPGSEEAHARLTLLEMNGSEAGSVVFTIPAMGQRDIIVRDMAGFLTDSYGLVRLDFCGGPIDGRVSYYRPSAAGAYDFAYSVPFSAPLYGETAVGFNTFQPSLNPADRGNLVANWLTIVNLGLSEQHFTLERRALDGSPINTVGVTVNAGARADVEAGHENPGPSNVGLIRIIPSDYDAPYLANITRFGYNQMGGFDFAFPLMARAGSGRALVVPISTTVSTQNWLEVTNTLATPIAVNVNFFRSDGGQLEAGTAYLAPFAQQHFDVNARLGPGQVGMAVVDASSANAIIAQSMIYMRSPGSGSILGMYGSQAREVLGTRITGSYNLYLGMYNWFKLSNPGSTAVQATLAVNSASGGSSRSIVVPPYGSLDFGLHETANYGTARDSYGVIEVEAAPGSPLLGQLLRIYPDASTGQVGFAFPTEVHSVR